MSALWPLAAATAAGAHAGLQLTVHLVVYPALADASAALDEPRALAQHARHTARMSRAVAPVYGALAVTAAGWLLADRGVLAGGFTVLLLAVLALTAGWAVPLHRQLGAPGHTGESRALRHQQLARVDLARLGLAVGLVVVSLLGAAS